MERVNDLYETVVTWEPAGTIRAAVSVATGSTAEVNRSSAYSPRTRPSPKTTCAWATASGGYLVDFVIEGTRWRQLFLSREDACMKIRIDTAGFQRDMEAFAAALEENTVAAVTDACDVIEADAKARCPRDTGFLRSSITSDVQPWFGAVFGRVGHQCRLRALRPRRHRSVQRARGRGARTCRGVGRMTRVSGTRPAARGRNRSSKKQRMPTASASSPFSPSI